MPTEKYQTLLEEAVDAVHHRRFFSHYPEHPKAYGEDGAATGQSAYQQRMNQPFKGLQQESDHWRGEEISPYTGEKLGITYPVSDPDHLIDCALKAGDQWAGTTPRVRAAILIDALDKLQGRFFEIAYATMHTTGQSFIMSFQASGPHAADRALEAIALGYHELTRFPEEVQWVKPMGKFDISLQKTYRPLAKGPGLVIGCSTFPVWNSLPAVYADLVTGNPVIIKPHPGAVLPMAIVVAEIQRSLSDSGYDPHLCQLAADTAEKPVTQALCEHPLIKLIDYTGATAFGHYVESLASGANGLTGKTVFTEKAGVNSVILDSVRDTEAVMDNLAFSVCLYSGQMCTAPQNIFIPASGIQTGEGRLTYQEVVEKLKAAIIRLVSNPKTGPGTLGAIQNERTLERARTAANEEAGVPLQGDAVLLPEFSHARTMSPTILETTSDHPEIYGEERFGPVLVLIKTGDTDESIRLARSMAEKHGAITCAAYSTDAATMEKITQEMNRAFTPVTFNFTGFIWVNQHAAFSDFHVSGGNPAGNAGFTDPLFINRRFVWVGNRIMVN